MSLASGKVALVEKEFIKTGHPKFRVGDTIRVHVRIKEGEKSRIQMFEGAVISLNNTGSRRTMTVRKVSHGVGVERVFPIYSPNVTKIDVMTQGSVRRSKLYYIRKLSGRAARIKEAEVKRVEK